MRVQLSDALLKRAPNSDMIFLTGDLGFMALEKIRDAMGTRFINAGVAEQNMMGVAAGLSRQDLEVWVYSIAPFCYARPFEQVRNDICFHNLPVKLIGNGGGYGYGVQGPTHHAIEDYGVLLTLPNMTAFIPTFDEDIEFVIPRMAALKRPGYLRLGRGEKLPEDFDIPSYSAWRQLTRGGGDTVIAVGPIAGVYLEGFLAIPLDRRPNFWIISELPVSLHPAPKELLGQIEKSQSLLVIEEHVERGSFASEFMLNLCAQGLAPKKFKHFFAKKHTYERYGSQAYMREQSGLSANDILSSLSKK